ncbi:hypothetical protein ACLOJK_004183 [Asimina triloba]
MRYKKNADGKWVSKDDDYAKSTSSQQPSQDQVHDDIPNTVNGEDFFVNPEDIVAGEGHYSVSMDGLDDTFNMDVTPTPARQPSSFGFPRASLFSTPTPPPLDLQYIPQPCLPPPIFHLQYEVDIIRYLSYEKLLLRANSLLPCWYTNTKPLQASFLVPSAFGPLRQATATSLAVIAPRPSRMAASVAVVVPATTPRPSCKAAIATPALFTIIPRPSRKAAATVPPISTLPFTGSLVTSTMRKTKRRTKKLDPVSRRTTRLNRQDAQPLSPGPCYGLTFSKSQRVKRTLPMPLVASTMRKTMRRTKKPSPVSRRTTHLNRQDAQPLSPGPRYGLASSKSRWVKRTLPMPLRKKDGTTHHGDIALTPSAFLTSESKFGTPIRSIHYLSCQRPRHETWRTGARFTVSSLRKSSHGVLVPRGNDAAKRSRCQRPTLTSSSPDQLQQPCLLHYRLVAYPTCMDTNVCQSTLITPLWLLTWWRKKTQSNCPRKMLTAKYLSLRQSLGV